MASRAESLFDNTRYSFLCKVLALASTTACFGQMPRHPVITTRGFLIACAALRRFNSDFNTRFNSRPSSERLRHFLHIRIGEPLRDLAVPMDDFDVIPAIWGEHPILQQRLNANHTSHDKSQLRHDCFTSSRKLVRDDHISHSFVGAKDVINTCRFKFRESKPLSELTVMQSHSVWQSRFLCGALLACAFALPCAAHAQETSTESSTAATDLPEPSALEWSLLSPELPLIADKSGKFRARNTSTGETMSWDRTEKSDGASAMTVKQSVLPFADAKVGADLNVASQMPGTSSDAFAGKLNGSSSYQSTGSAWANMTAPGLGNIWDKTTIEARVDPMQEQSRLNTSISKSVPLGSQQYSLTAQTGYNVIQSAVPMIGADGRIAKGAVEVDRSAKLEFKNTGTSVLAGETISTMDEKWLRRFGVEQKVFGGVSVSGSVSETPLGAPNRSLTAGFKHSW